MLDADYWAPRECLRPPIDAIFRAAERLSEAVDAHLAGRPAEAARLLALADCEEVRGWLDPLMGTSARFPIRNALVRYRVVPNSPPHLSKGERPTPRMPGRAVQRRIIDRDGFRCVFCGIPVLRAKVRRRLTQLYPAEAYWGTQCHAGLWCMWLQFDHLLPHGRGGTSDEDNMVITCAGCNYGRMNHTLAEVGLMAPKAARAGLNLNGHAWDGLERLLMS